MLALSAESSSARERENGSDRERMGDSARDRECANERVPVCERGGGGGRSLDSPDALFGAVSSGKSSRATIREFELAVLDLEGKKERETPPRTTIWKCARKRRFVSHTSP